uniref:synemin n=1 Tax=Euleptes europaea TaxID=460621 RepID=UPI002541A8F8|nr:synemin [Euleptes europaea]
MQRDEEAELRELNARLAGYVGRLRALEGENGRLAQELAALRRSGRPGEREREVAELRRAAAELRRTLGEAEREREALRGERGRLEALGAQLLDLRRRRLEPEAGELRARLEALAADCAALEAQLGRLRAERGRLQEERRRRPPAKTPARQRETPPGRREAGEPRALVLRWSGARCLERYAAELAALRELEGRLRPADAQTLRARNRHGRRRAEGLRRRAEELAALAQRLEAERRAQAERHGAQRNEYEMVIDALEEEKRFLTLSIAEYLKDYHELLQVKASLSLEIATYRALLEGESSQWILLWEEEYGRKVPQGVRNLLHEYSNRYSAYRQEKGRRAFPAIQNVDTRYKTPIANMSSSAVYSSQTKPSRIQTAATEKAFRKDAVRSESRPSAAIRKDVTHQRTVTDQRQVRTFSPSPVISRESEVRQRTLPETKRAEAVTAASFSKESAEVRKDTTIPNTFENVRPKIAGVSATSYSLNSSSKETKYERTQEGTDVRASKQISEVKPMEEKSVLLQERHETERSAREVTDSVRGEVEKKLAGLETTVNFEKKMEIKHGTEEEKHTMKEPSITDSRKEASLAEDGTPKNGKYVKWEERIRVDTSGTDLPSSRTMDKSGSFQHDKNVTTQSKEAVEIPIQVQPFKNNRAEITLQDSKPLIGKQKDEATPKFSKNIPETELNRVFEEGSPQMDTLLTESIAENIVSDILKGFVQKSSDSGLPTDTKFTFSEKKLSEDGKMKSEVTVQSTIQEDLDESDLERFLKQDVKGTGDAKGALSEAALEDIINASLKRREGQGKRTVQVEIVEEPLGTAADERAEFPTPFEVEEAEDTLPYMAGHLYYGAEEKATTSAAEDLKRQQPSVIVSHVEEVYEGDDVVDEEKYFVSTPEEHPLAHEKDDGSRYGQIHIEEESTIKYSWQDEFLQGAQKRVNEGKGSPEIIYQMMGEEENAFISKDEQPVEQVAHAESIIIEREIKIPHEFHTSIKSLFSEESKDPKHQLKEALETLEDSLPESVKQELSALTKEGQGDSSSLEVDIRKVEQTKKGGLVTIVAEVSLSETLDSDQFNTGYLGEGLAGERESPTRVSTTYNFDERRQQESESYDNSRSKAGIIEVSSTPWTTEAVSSSAKLTSSDGVRYHTSEHVVSEGPVFKSLGLDSASDPSHMQSSFDINRSVRQIAVGPTEIRRTEQVLHEGPISENLEFGTGGFEAGATTSVSRSMRGFTHGPEEILTMEEIVYRGPVRGPVEVSGPENPSQAQFSSDRRSTKHVMLGSKQIVEEIVFEGVASDLSADDNSRGLSQTKGSAESSRSIRHIRIDPRGAPTQQTVFEGPLSGIVEHSRTGNSVSFDGSVRHIKIEQKETPVTNQAIYEESSTKTTEPSHDQDWLSKEGTLDTNTTIRHIKLAPKELVTMEQIVWKGPISEQRLEFSESGPTFSSDGSVRHVTLGQKEIWSGERVAYHGSVSGSSGIGSAGEDTLETEGPTESSRSVRHIRVGPVETHTEQIVFQGPVSDKTPKIDIVALSPTDGPPESQSLGRIKIGPKETSFTFQMDITKVAGGGQGAKIQVSDTKDAHPAEDTATGGDRGVESEQRSEESSFEQTVQLQRMVDHRSVVSDDKKIALLYLNENEEEEEEEGPWF